MKTLLDKTQIKICHLTGHSPFDGRIFHKEAKTLVKGGYEVVLIGQHSTEEVVDGVKIIPLPTPKSRFERAIKTICILFTAALRERADVYHFHDPEFRNSSAASLLVYSAIKYLHEHDLADKFDFEGSMIFSVEKSFRYFGATQTPYFQIWKKNFKARVVWDVGIWLKKKLRK